MRASYSTIEYSISLDQAIERLAALILRGSIPRHEKFAGTFQEVLSKLATQTPGRDAKLMREQAGDLVATGFSEEHATQLAAIHRLDDLIAATRIAMQVARRWTQYQSNVHHRRAFAYHTASSRL